MIEPIPEMEGIMADYETFDAAKRWIEGGIEELRAMRLLADGVLPLADAKNLEAVARGFERGHNAAAHVAARHIRDHLNAR
jgi:hypothetical protein